MPRNNSDFYDKKKDWSKIKDSLLGCYLVPYFQKLLRTGKPICYIDCFAGKGKFKDGNDGSPLIALKIREEALSKTKLRNNKGIEMFFIEVKYADELTKNISGYCGGENMITVIHGKFEEKIMDLLEKKKGYNVFLYIDPYGIKSLDFNLFRQIKEFKSNSLEMLINFNSFGFLRVAFSAMKVNIDNEFPITDELNEDEFSMMSNIDKINKLNSVAGGEYWKNIVEDYRNDFSTCYQAEQDLSTSYKKAWKEHYAYVLDLPIRIKRGQNPKYRMVHICNHLDGCYLMAKNILLRKGELILKVQDKGEGELFPDEYQIDEHSISQKNVKEMVLSLLKAMLNNKPCGTKKFLVSFVNEYGVICDFSLIFRIFNELEKIGILCIDRVPSQTKTGKKSTFWEEHGKHKVFLKKGREWQ